MSDRNVSDADVRQWILEILYTFWRTDPFQQTSLKQIRDKHAVLKELGENVILRNLEYLQSSALIANPSTSEFWTGITSMGVVLVEATRTTEDTEFRVRILRELKRLFDEKPEEFVQSVALISNTGLSSQEIIRNVKLLGDLGFIRVSWYLGSDFQARITPLGINYLNQPTKLESDTIFMAKSLRYRFQVL